MTRPRYADPPVGVASYGNPFVFLAENPAREARQGMGDDKLAGWDLADGFRLAETQLPGTPDSEWRISVVNGEIYAVMRRLPMAREYTFDGPVWLIARIPEHLNDHPDWGGEPPVAVMPLLRDVEGLRHEPDSLLTAIRLIQERLPQLTAP